eukprot:2623492-Prymnesium_polylepis.1
MPSRFSRQPERVVRARRLERAALSAFKVVDELPRHRASPRVESGRRRAGVRLEARVPNHF